MFCLWYKCSTDWIEVNMLPGKLDLWQESSPSPTTKNHEVHVDRKWQEHRSNPSEPSAHSAMVPSNFRSSSFRHSFFGDAEGRLPRPLVPAKATAAIARAAGTQSSSSVPITKARWKTVLQNYAKTITEGFVNALKKKTLVTLVTDGTVENPHSWANTSTIERFWAHQLNSIAVS